MENLLFLNIQLISISINVSQLKYGATLKIVIFVGREPTHTCTSFTSVSVFFKLQTI